jgi:hypothetical protein
LRGGGVGVFQIFTEYFSKSSLLVLLAKSCNLQLYRFSLFSEIVGMPPHLMICMIWQEKA